MDALVLDKNYNQFSKGFKKYGMIPSNVWMEDSSTILTDFKPKISSRLPDILDYFNIMDIYSLLLVLLTLMVSFLYIMRRDGDRLQSMWDLLEFLQQKNDSQFIKKRPYRILVCFSLFFFLTIYLNYIAVDMIVQLENVPVNTLKDLLDKRNAHIFPVVQYFRGFTASYVGDTDYKEAIRRSEYMNNGTVKYVCLDCSSTLALSKEMITGKFALISSSLANIMVKRFMCKQYKNVVGIRWLSQELDTRFRVSFPINPNSSHLIKNEMNIVYVFHILIYVCISISLIILNQTSI